MRQCINSSEPGIYAYVNHNMTEAVQLGATAHFKVEGTWNNDLMTQVRPPEPIPTQQANASRQSTSPAKGQPVFSQIFQ